MTQYLLERDGGVPLSFEGALLHSLDTARPGADRWSVLALYVVADCVGGQVVADHDCGWVLERIGETRLPGEVTRRSVDYLETPEAVRDALMKSDHRPDGSGRRYLPNMARYLLEGAASVDNRLARALVETL